MPIKPENKARYPRDWPQIRERILARAARRSPSGRPRCEHEGCTAEHHQVGYWLAGQWNPVRNWRGRVTPESTVEIEREGFKGHIKIIRIVITVAHLDHTPEHCDDENLRAWCQRHHLAYDQKHHLTTAYMSRREGRNTMELPL